MFVNETSSCLQCLASREGVSYARKMKLGGDKRSSLLDRNLHNGFKKFHNVHEYLKKSSKLLTIFFKWGQGLILKKYIIDFLYWLLVVAETPNLRTK
jgi:hypothetical protein